MSEHAINSQRRPPAPPRKDDASLVAALRDREHVRAWMDFHRRFRPILEANARRQRIPSQHWPTCIIEVLDDEAMRLASSRSEAPLDLPAYLVRASQHRYLRIKRAERSRLRVYDAASDASRDEAVVSSTCSQASLAASDGVDAPEECVAHGLTRLFADVLSELSSEDQLILWWVGEHVPHRCMATWLGMSYSACSKRVWRLCRRVRARALVVADRYVGSDRRDVDRVLRRLEMRPCVRGMALQHETLGDD